MFDHYPTLQSLRNALDTKQVGALEITESYLERIAATQETLNSFITVTDAHAREQAKHAQHEVDNGNSGPLTGIPYGAKDLLCTKEIATTAASRMLQSYVPPYNATVIDQCQDAVLLGKLNLDEFAMGTTGEYSAFGVTKNPYDLKRVAGGSSSGPAAAVASGQVPFAWGTDTGGSIRLPSAFTHTVGYKPSYGTFSRYGVISMASSLDTIGTFTRNVEDAVYVAEHLAPYRDDRDMTSVRDRSWTKHLWERVQQTTPRSLRFGVPKEFMAAEGMDPSMKAAFEQALETLRAAGIDIVEVSLPAIEYGIHSYYVITPAEVSSNMARYDGLQFGEQLSAEDFDAKNASLRDRINATREHGFRAEVKRRILIGTMLLSKGYEDRLYHKASQVRTLIMQDFDRAFAQVDVLLSPTSPKLPFLIGENDNDPLALWLADIFTVPMNIAGVPTVSVPGVLAEGLPTGIQCIGPNGRDDIALAAGWLVEKIVKAQPPTLAV